MNVNPAGLHALYNHDHWQINVYSYNYYRKLLHGIEEYKNNIILYKDRIWYNNIGQDNGYNDVDHKS